MACARRRRGLAYCRCTAYGGGGHPKAAAASIRCEDEAAAMEVAGFKPIMIAGSKDNIKITVESDLLLASQILKTQASDNESK